MQRNYEPFTARIGDPEPRSTLSPLAKPRETRLRATFRSVLAGATLGWCAVCPASVPTIGLPVTRTYSIEEIGSSRGPQLSFDQIGRLGVLTGKDFIVLNDNDWINLTDDNLENPPLLEAVVGRDGQFYFVGLANWGQVHLAENGKILPESFRPANYPAWINSTVFTEIVMLEDKIFFAGINGLVVLDPETKQQDFVQYPLATLFKHGSDLYVSSNAKGTSKLNLQTLQLETVDSSNAMHDVAYLSDGTVVGATTDRGLVSFDGRRFAQFDIGLPPSRVQVSVVETLPDGGFAAAVEGEGLFVFDGKGQPKLAATTGNYRRIYDLASQEPGVLWISRESSVEKLLYNDPVSIVDQRSDVLVGWPLVAKWGQRTVIASNGRLYDMVNGETSWQNQFREVPNIPEAGAWSIAGNESHLLIGNGGGVFVRHEDGFSKVPGITEANRLFLQEKNLCLVVGTNKIAAIAWNGERWEECAAQIDGVGFPSIMHEAGDSLWLELGLDLAARIWFENGAIHSQLITDFPWDEPTWVNLGILGDYIVACGPGDRAYIDRKTMQFVEAPALDDFLEEVSYTILRLTQDHKGTIWATHPSGALIIEPDGDSFRVDTESLRSIRDQYPVITLIESEHAWISTESALYHVDQDFESPPIAQLNPFLVSVTDGATGKQIYSAAKPSQSLESLPYSQNHLVFEYFAGGYTPLREPSYEFSMKSNTKDWTVQSPDSNLTLPNLEEGDYQLTAQLWDGIQKIGNPMRLDFSIDPPWYRSNLAYFAYATAIIVIALAIGRWAVLSAKSKRDFLEKLVRERTEELRATMEKLTEEARTSATLAERNRLAGEIHDSLQQGLSGIALQLDATLKLNGLQPDLHNRLSVARRMVSYTRQEVQQAVWDLESPLLQNDDLSEALNNMANLLGAGSITVQVETVGEPVKLSSRTQHHVLRIAQEAITNATRHSHSTLIQVRLEYLDTELTLDIKDNGTGFDANQIFSDGLNHFGLRGLRTRASKINGLLTIDSKSGEGTSVHLSIPISTPETVNAV